MVLIQNALALRKKIDKYCRLIRHLPACKILSVGPMMSNARQARLAVEGCSQPNDERALGHPEHILFIQDTQFLPG